MPKNAKLFISLLISFGLVLPFLFVIFRLKNETSLNLQLKNQLQIQHLEATNKITRLSNVLQEKEKQLQGLSDVQAIKSALLIAQANMDNLNKELEQVKKDKSILQETNFNISSRLENTTRELMRTMEDLRLAREAITNLENSKVLPLKAQIDEYGKMSNTKDKEFYQLKEELAKLQQANLELANNNKSLEEKIKALEGEGFSLQTKLDGFQKKVSKENAPIQALQDTINQLNLALAQKENQLQALESELAGVNATKSMQEEKISQQQKTINELSLTNQNLNVQISQTKSELSKKRAELDNQKQEMARLQQDATRLQADIARFKVESITARQDAQEFKDWQQAKTLLEDNIKKLQQELNAKNSAISALTAEKQRLTTQVDKFKTLKDTNPEESARYEKTKEQLAQLTEILVKKELELDKARKESQDTKDNIAVLQAKLTDLGKNLDAVKARRDNLEEFGAQRKLLQERLNETQETLDRKTALVDSLQENVDFLNQQLARKESERKAAESQLAKLNATRDDSREELAKQNERYQDLDAANKSLKTQVSQLSGAITQKELELEQRRNEIFSLKQDIDSLKYRYARLEKELTDAKERQKKTLDDLTSAVKLNTELQQKIIGVSKSLESSESDTEQRQQADELRRKIKVYLEPENN